jgi:hypothetical protein
MTKIDHFLASVEWLDIFPRTDLQALASLGSDHCPLFLQGDTAYDFYRGFRFEAYWVNMPGFMETVKDAWDQPVNTQNAMLRMHVKLLRVARALKIWRRSQFSEWKLKSAFVQIILLELEKAQERRTLSEGEVQFKKFLKAKSLGLAAIQKARARQHSRLTWIRKGDSNTRFFHIHANARKKKAYIASLNSDTGIAVSQNDKMRVAVDFFNKAVGVSATRTRRLNWEALGYTPHNLDDLDMPFTEMELNNTIKGLPAEKAPGPDGYIGLFYKKCWDIIKGDLLEAIMGFYNHKTSKMGLFNEANIVLLPKKPTPTTITDYRPISLINSVVKIITKLLANRLAPHMNTLVSYAQNAFIKQRCIHDNFLYVQRVIQLLHKKKQSSLFIKLDISKAFDSVGWQFLLEVLEALGFSLKWRDWISDLLRTSSSKILINGSPSRRVPHARGLRQGDPLSPLLFIIAIDPLQRIIDRAAQQGLLQPVLPKAANLRCSLYADDVALFAKPSSVELSRLQKILIFFGECSGLKVNMSKTEIFPIRMQPSALESLLRDFPGKISAFPGKYLGLPLHTRKLRKIEVQPLIDKIGARLPGWKGRFLSSSGRETLVKTVLSAVPIYHLTVFQAQKWMIKKIDQIRRSFLWRGETPDRVCSGHSLLNWPTTCSPKSKGGLGILDFERFTRALRLRWLWYQWRQPERAWSKLEVPCDSVDRDLFNASTVVTVGNGKKASFWTSSWLNGSTAKAIAPSLYRKSKRKKFTVYQGLRNRKWIDHIYPPASPQEVHEFVNLWEAIGTVTINDTVEDEIRWRWTEDGEYSTKSAYLAQFEGRFTQIKITPIWKAHAEAKCRFFAWTLLHKRILTASNLYKRGWIEDTDCRLCGNELETPTHLCKSCPFTKEVWGILKQWMQLTTIQSVNDSGALYSYWWRCRRKFQKSERRKVDGIFIYFWWNIWKERNRRQFQQITLNPIQVATLCKDDIMQYRRAIEAHGAQEVT